MYAALHSILSIFMTEEEEIIAYYFTQAKAMIPELLNICVALLVVPN